MGLKNREFENLVQVALGAGASEVMILSARKILVDEKLADRCLEPRCPSYGLSKSCPPHVSGPAAFRKALEAFSHALCFKIDVPADAFHSADSDFSSESRAVFRLLHEIAAAIEKSAVDVGFTSAKAYAGGSCKKFFCLHHPDCGALTRGVCRNPEHARPSMSGFGIDVSRLFKSCGWEMRWDFEANGLAKMRMASLCGMVLIC